MLAQPGDQERADPPDVVVGVFGAVEALTRWLAQEPPGALDRELAATFTRLGPLVD